MPKKSHRINKRRSRGTRKHGGVAAAAAALAE